MPTPKAPVLTINVTQDMIDDSVERDSSHCMIAESVKDTAYWARSVSVDLQTIRLSDPSQRLRYTYLTPRVAQIALIQFDQGEKPDPFTFTLRRGHVTNMIKRKPPETAPRGRSEAQEASIKKARGIASIGAQTRLHYHDGQKDQVPVPVGGRPPPTTPFARRRAFGVRALDR